MSYLSFVVDVVKKTRLTVLPSAFPYYLGFAAHGP